MPRISDAATRRKLTTLKTAFDAKAEHIAAAEAKRTELHARLAALRQRIESEQAQAVVPESEAGKALADELVADPVAELDEAHLASLVENQAAIERASHVQGARIRVLKEAAAKLAPPIAASDRLVEQLTREQSEARSEFLDACHAALFVEFRSRFVALRDEVIEPMLAIGLSQPGSSTRDNVEWEGNVILKSFTPGDFAGWDRETLLRMDAHGMGERSSAASEVVDSLLQAAAI